MLTESDFPITCCGVRHEWPSGVSIDKGKVPFAPLPKVMQNDCLHRGDVLRSVQCSSCRGKVMLKVYGCDVHGECSPGAAVPGVRSCSACGDYAKFPAITKRNLIYHIFPAKDNDGWRHNIAQLRKRWDAFNGRRVIAVAIGERTETTARVQRELRGLDYQFFSVRNDVDLREMVTFPKLLEFIASESPDEATFYAHTKGNSSAGDANAVRWWRNNMYRRLLTPAAWSQLSRYPMVGCLKIVWPETSTGPFPTAQPHVPEEKRIKGIGNFMFAGTFFWFRHDAVFTNWKWREVPRDRYGAEAWPSVLFRWQDVLSIWQPWPENVYPSPSPYNPTIYTPNLRIEDDQLA